jgi:quinolinate synthase
MNIVEEIIKLKEEKKAIILAHYYVDAQIQAIADFVGDSLALAQFSKKTEAEIIIFCGVHFMAETAKILNPNSKVLIPDLNAGCSLADAAPIEKFIEYKKQIPDAVVVSYINCTADIKAESDFICTSSNAIDIVNAIPEEKQIIFAPDKNLGKYVEKVTNRKLHIWDGACMVHVNISIEKLNQLIQTHDDAELVAHPECNENILEKATFIGSTKALIEHVKTSEKLKFLVATEAGILYKMKKEAPDKIIIPAPSNENNTCACAECPYMKMNTLEKILLTLKNESPEIQIPEHIRLRAKKAIDNMLETC